MADSEGVILFIYDGVFERDECIKYVGGKRRSHNIDTDLLSYMELLIFVSEFTERKVKNLWYVDPLCVGDGRFVMLDSSGDDSILRLTELILKYGEIEVYVEHEDVTSDRRETEYEGVFEDRNLDEGHGQSEVVMKGKKILDAAEDEADKADEMEDNSGDEEEHNDGDVGRDDDASILKKLFGNWEGNDVDVDIDTHYLSDDEEELNEIRSKVKEFNVKWADKKVQIKIMVGGEDNDGGESNMGSSSTGQHKNSGVEGFPKYDRNCVRPEFCVSQTFESTREFKDAIDKHSIVEQRPIKLVKNTAKWVRAKCSGQRCRWAISLAFDNRTDHFHVKTLEGTHTCGISFKNRRLSSKWLATHFFAEIKSMPTIKLCDLKEMIREKLGADVSLMKCRGSKLRVFKKILGCYEEEYGLLCDYAEEIKRRNPGTTCLVRLDPPISGRSPVFNAFYVCFDALRRGFLAGCRMVIGVDGCFLKGVCKGEILVAVGRDGNDQMFPIAWAVVKVENKDTWTWFLENLIEDLGIGDGLGWTIISDKQKVSYVI